MSKTVKTSFGAEYALMKNDLAIALKRLELIRNDLEKWSTSTSCDVHYVCKSILEWYDAPILLDEFFKHVL